METVGTYFTPLFKIITKENTKVVDSKNVKQKFVGKNVGSKRVGHYLVRTAMSNLISETRETLPSRIIAKVGTIRRIWMLDRAIKNAVIYRSMFNDQLVLVD